MVSLEEIGAGKRRDRRRRRIEDGDEDQSPTRGAAGGRNAGHGVEADDHVRQPGRPDHEGRGDEEDIERTLGALSERNKAEFDTDLIELIQPSVHFVIGAFPSFHKFLCRW